MSSSNGVKYLFLAITLVILKKHKIKLESLLISKRPPPLKADSRRVRRADS